MHLVCINHPLIPLSIFMAGATSETLVPGGLYSVTLIIGSVVKPSKRIFFEKKNLLGNSLLGSLVFTKYWEPSKKEVFFY